MKTTQTITEATPPFDLMLWTYEHEKTLRLVEAILKDILGENGQHGSVLKVMEAMSLLRGDKSEYMEAPTEWEYLKQLLSEFNRMSASI